MDSTVDNLLEEYRCADFNKRLHLYLQYSDLRSEFVGMDRNGLQHGPPRSVPGFNRFPRIHLATLINLKVGCVRKLFGST